MARKKVADEVIHTYDEERLVTKHDKAAKAKVVVGKHLTVTTEGKKVTLVWDWAALEKEVAAATAGGKPAKPAKKKAPVAKTETKKPAAVKPAAKKAPAKKSAKSPKTTK